MPAGTITALQAQAHDPQRVNVFIDRAFAIGVSLNTISRESLYIGKQLTEEDYARLEQAEQADKAVQAAMRLLEARPRSIAELRQRLLRKGFDPATSDQALEQLQRLGLADDASFARLWVEHRQSARPRGAAALRDELRRKGIDRNLIDDVLSDEELTGDEQEGAWTQARAALRKYAGSPDRATFARRMSGYLQRRGFGFETIRPIIDQLWEELSDRPADEDM
jgi:regulatory protein